MSKRCWGSFLTPDALRVVSGVCLPQPKGTEPVLANCMKERRGGPELSEWLKLPRPGTQNFKSEFISRGGGHVWYVLFSCMYGIGI